MYIDVRYDFMFMFNKNVHDMSTRKLVNPDTITWEEGVMVKEAPFYVVIY